MKKDLNKVNNGFTLIELLLVIAIIALIVALVLVGVSMARVKANNSRIINSMDQLRKQAEVIYAENGMENYCVGGGTKCFGVNNPNLKALVDDIYARNGGTNPVIVGSSGSFCLSAILADSRTVCYDNAGAQTGSWYGKSGGVGACAGSDPVACK